MEAGSGGKHAGDCQAIPGAAVGELGLRQGRQQLLSQPWSFTSKSKLRRERRIRATNIPGRNVSMAPRKRKKAAIDSLVFINFVFYFLLNNMHGGQLPDGLPMYLNPCTN